MSRATLCRHYVRGNDLAKSDLSHWAETGRRETPSQVRSPLPA